MRTSNPTGRQRLATLRGAVALTVALLGFAAPAQATFAGRNGDFAYGFELGYPTDEYSYESYAWRVGMIGQDGNRRRFITDGREPAFSPRGRRLAVAQRSDWGSAVVSLRGRPLMRLSSGIDRPQRGRLLAGASRLSASAAPGSLRPCSVRRLVGSGLLRSMAGTRNVW